MMVIRTYGHTAVAHGPKMAQSLDNLQPQPRGGDVAQWRETQRLLQNVTK